MTTGRDLIRRRPCLVPRRRWTVPVILAVIGLLTGCNSVGHLRIPVATGLVAAPTTSDAAVATAETETPVAGMPTTTAVAIAPGSATVNGTVFGPAGPVLGATVQAQRLVGDGEATTEATTGADGSFVIPGVLGGRYRVRAWRAPGLAMTEPQIFFLGGTGTMTVSLQMRSYQGLKVAADLNPSTPVVGEGANLAVEVTQPTVDANGVVIDRPQVSVVVAIDAPAFSSTDGSTGQGITDARGEVIFALSCLQSGPAPITVTAGVSTSMTLSTPSCRDPVTTTSITTTVPATTVPVTTLPPTAVPTIRGPGSTATTQPGPSPASSTTAAAGQP